MPSDAKGLRPACHDCGLPYEDDGFADLVVPHDVWNGVLSPTGDGGGLLCPTCMVRAAHRAGIECPAVWRSGPFAALPLPDGSVLDEIEVWFRESAGVEPTRGRVNAALLRYANAIADLRVRMEIARSCLEDRDVPGRVLRTAAAALEDEESEWSLLDAQRGVLFYADDSEEWETAARILRLAIGEEER